MTHHDLEIILILLVIASAVGLFTRWIRQPYTIALVIVGLVVAMTKITPSILITHDIVFTFILPPLLFQGALHMDLAELKENWKSVAMLAVPGVVVSTFLIGFLMHYFLQVDLVYALLFGALITPTDPISVLAILKEVKAPDRLRVILEGESLFNDGTGVVVFTIILGLITGGHHVSVGGAISRFLMVAGGGTIIGLIIGLISYKILQHINDHLWEVTYTVLLVFGTPLLAEALHCSGIIALVVAGLIMGNFGRYYSMSEKTREAMENFWEVIDFIVNSLLFLIIGIELQAIPQVDLGNYLYPIVGCITFMLIARAIVVYPVVKIKNTISHNDIPPFWNHILFWGGLKGSIPIALVVGLPTNFEWREPFLVIAFAIVLFSLIIQGLTIKPLLKTLKISK